MKLMEDAFLRHSIEIRTTPEKIFEFLSNLVDDESYRAWHSEDHVTLRCLKGSPWQEGSVIYAEEYIDGELHKLTFEFHCCPGSWPRRGLSEVFQVSRST